MFLNDIFFFFGFGFVLVNLFLFVVLVVCFFVWLLIWWMKFGFEICFFGVNVMVVVYVGIFLVCIIVIIMMIFGGLVGMMVINEIMGF